jgi:hypothetical protein
MKSIILFLLTIVSATIALPTACWAAGDEPGIIVEMDRDKIYDGESVLYRVTLNNVDNPRQPDLSGFDDFLVTYIGDKIINFQGTVNNNGQITQINRRGRQYNYRLTPKKTGLLTIPAPTAEIDGKTLRGRTMSLQVAAPGDQDVVRMDIVSEPESVYPMQPFTVTLSVSVKAMPEPYADENPTGVQSTPPELQIPWIDDDRLPEGLQAKLDWRRWLASLQSRGAGFSINNIGDNSVFSFFEERRIAFMPKPQKIRMTDKSGKTVEYWRFQFQRTFIAKKVGDYSFGPVSLKGTFATGLDPVKRAKGEAVYATAKPLSVKIKDVPEEGRPDTYVGAIGQFKFDADLTPRKAKTGDPMTLTLAFTGEGTLSGITAPDVAKIPGIAKNFKIYEATDQTKGDRKQFTYSLRPLEAGIKEFSAVDVSYFDVRDEKYVTLTSPPMPVQIEKADKLAGRDITASSNGISSGQKDLEMRREGIFANITDLGQVSDQSIRPLRWLAGLGGVTGFYAVMLLVVIRVRRLSGDTQRQRRRAAPGNARRLAAVALKDLSAGRVREGADRMESAIVGLVADWNDLSAAGMTPAEACRQLQTLGIDGETLHRISRFLDNCECVHYGATTQAGDALRRDAKGVLEATIHALRKTKRTKNL